MNAAMSARSGGLAPLLPAGDGLCCGNGEKLQGVFMVRTALRFGRHDDVGFLEGASLGMLLGVD